MLAIQPNTATIAPVMVTDISSYALVSKQHPSELHGTLVGVQNGNYHGPNCYHPSHEERVHPNPMMMRGRPASLETEVRKSNHSRMYHASHIELPLTQSDAIRIDASRPKQIDRILGRVEVKRRENESKGVYRSGKAALQTCLGDCQPEDHYGPKLDMASLDLLKGWPKTVGGNGDGEEASRLLGLQGKVVVRRNVRGAPSYQRYLDSRESQKNRDLHVEKARKEKYSVACEGPVKTVSSNLSDFSSLPKHLLEEGGRQITAVIESGPEDFTQAKPIQWPANFLDHYGQFSSALFAVD
ncbi:MAG: hypothetical protein NTX24_02230 [Candidatus Pacearchaeota archaeon]|nr:hypothetical protein [Candidatus Pacearchaeota archaeon]